VSYEQAVVAEECKQKGSRKLEEYSSYKLWAVLAAEARKQASQFLVGDSHRMSIVEEELGVGLWILNVWLEDFIYV
jgi:hypothetical protein